MSVLRPKRNPGANFNAGRRPRKRLPQAALLVLSAALAGFVGYLTWPSRVTVLCEQMPQLAAFAMCAATLLVFSFRAMAGARTAGQDLRIAGSSAILAGLTFFLSIHFVAQYRKPCLAVQQQLHAQPTVKSH